MVRAMTTLKPQLVRADTLDLQDHNTPSAQDHSRQPTHPSPYGYGPAAPHQAQTLRQAEHEAYQQQHSSPRASEDKSAGAAFGYGDAEDEAGGGSSQNGPMTSSYNPQDTDEGESVDSHDEDMDDDLLDKISSSPSIDDGKYPLPAWPPRVDSVMCEASPASSSAIDREIPSSSPFSSTPDHFPLNLSQRSTSTSHLGEFQVYQDIEEEDHQTGHHNHLDSENSTSVLATSILGISIPLSESQEFQKYLLPLDDPLLLDESDGSHENYSAHTYYHSNDNQYADWQDENVYILDHDSSSDDDTGDFSFTADDRFVDSGWGGECLRDTEDIDFEFVYALHTFVATVEGQANATKGDTMVLLDDSNSYWWLVRVVKDGSIGYLPAEHIETPTERLARLNKHRNIDLSASMLGDNPEKSKNPLKKAMRRRNAKTVQFTAPTYYEPSDYEYSDEEDEADESQLDQMGDDNVDDTDAVEESQDKPTGEVEQQAQRTAVTANGVQRMTSNESLNSNLSASPVKGLATESVLEQSKADEPVSRSRKGNVRNTDSFFRDDTAETKKISLTPRLLRGDSDANVSSVEQEDRQRPSIDTFDKVLAVDDKSKEKKKEKKGMLSGFFKRSKKGAVQEEAERPSEEARQSPQSKESLDSLNTRPEVGPERKPSKLQKTPRSVSPKASPTDHRNPQSFAAGMTQNTASATPSSTLRKVDSESSQSSDDPYAATNQNQSVAQVKRFPSLSEQRSIFSSNTSTTLKPTQMTTSTTTSPAKAGYLQGSKEQLDTQADVSDDDEPTPRAAEQENQSLSFETAGKGQSVKSELSDQPSTIDPSSQSFNAQKSHAQASGPGYIDTNPADSEGSASSSKPSPSSATHTPSTARSTPTWSDASLRMYMENNQDIKDLLIIVHDKSNVTPVGPDHPLMSNLFVDERTRLAEMQTQLDTMLMTWMGKKNSNLLSSSSLGG
ncbi:hypothetical protein B0A52_02043 [Exophiala mesophila]|uniref:SH3 domain-containing protein n=1 Tax=Exophiala mesophila TaxID=212818 RepID=A0A438NER8_EXOME|nr:hypothetical protein B0A52_02043 [Exophiala mesophila]